MKNEWYEYVHCATWMNDKCTVDGWWCSLDSEHNVTSLNCQWNRILNCLDCSFESHIPKAKWMREKHWYAFHHRTCVYGKGFSIINIYFHNSDGWTELLETRFWYYRHFIVHITRVCVCRSLRMNFLIHALCLCHSFVLWQIFIRFMLWAQWRFTWNFTLVDFNYIFLLANAAKQNSFDVISFICAHRYSLYA